MLNSDATLNATFLNQYTLAVSDTAILEIPATRTLTVNDGIDIGSFGGSPSIINKGVFVADGSPSFIDLPDTPESDSDGKRSIVADGHGQIRASSR